MANQAIALQARAPQSAGLGPAIAQGAQMINMMAQQRAAERQAAQAQQAIEQLASVIDESSQAAVQMMAAGQQQVTGVEQVAVAMRSINQATIQSLASTRQAEKAAQDLNLLARMLTEHVTQYKA